MENKYHEGGIGVGNIKKDFVYQSAYQLLLIVLPLITAPYIARVLGSENAGVYTYTYTIANYFVVFAMLGLEQYGNRSIARVRDDINKRNQVFSELLVLHLLMAIVITVIYFVYAVCFSGEYRFMMLLQGIYVLSAVFDVNWFFFGMEQFKITVTRNVIIKLMSVAAIFIFVKSKNDLWIYTIIMSAGTLASQVILWRFLPKYVSFKSISMKACMVHIRPVLTLFIAVIAANIYRMFDKVMLGWFEQMEELGCYDYADKIIRIPLSLITALGTVMLPKMSNLFAHKDTEKAEKMLELSAMFVLFMSFAMAFGIAGIAPEFAVIFLGEGYTESIALIMILAATIPLIGWNNYVRTQLLIPLQKDKIYTIGVCTGAVVNVLLNAVFIQLFNAKGAATATIFSYTAVMFIQTIPLMKCTNISSYFRCVPFPLFSGVLMFIVVRWIGKTMGISIATVCCEVIAGVLLYGILSFIYLYHKKIISRK